MKVSACLATRGNVDMRPLIDSLPREWEIIVWDNGTGLAGRVAYSKDGSPFVGGFRSGWAKVSDLGVYGRYAAIEYASHDVIYVQDDDVIVSDPESIAAEWVAMQDCDQCKVDHPGPIVANMPQEFRHDGYTDSCLVGFGACFHRDAPARAFKSYWAYLNSRQGLGNEERLLRFNRTCDVVFTTLAPARVLVDVPKTNREFAEDSDRMYRQPEHVAERARMLELARKVRDA